MKTLECCNCFIAFGIPDEMYSKRKKDHDLFYCPAGHGQRFTAESEEDKLRRERDLLKQQGAQKDDDIKRMREGWEKAERENTRITKRVHNGVCTCCNRSFANLARHMKTKHPEQAKLKVA